MQNVYLTKGESLAEQYFDAGQLFSETIGEGVKKIAKKRSQLAKNRRLVAEKTWINIQDKPVAEEFVRCFKQWCEGAKISYIQGMWLLTDNLSGCQTFMGRYHSGVALLHTEEDFACIAERMRGHHTLSFTADGEVSRCLVYNDLMPGAGLYGWKKDLIVAVDSLFLREDKITEVESPLIANIVAWMVWRMKPEEASPEHILQNIASMGTLIDGYAINVVRKVGARIEGYKLTLAREDHLVEYLGLELGSYIRQVNIVDPTYPKIGWALPPRNIWKGGYKLFKQRLKTMSAHARLYQKIARQEVMQSQLENIHTQIQQSIFGELRDAYINVDVGAVCVGLVDLRSGTSVSCKLNDRQAWDKIEYLDLVE